MTLTEQLATESLPEYTEFYVRKKDGSTDTQTWLNRRHSSAVEWWNTFNITEVLAPVPSYEEWQKLQKNLKSITDSYKVVAGRCTQLEKFLEEFNALDVAEENEAIKTKLSIQCEANEELRKENQQLKELLLQIRNRQSLIREYLYDCKLGNAWDLLYQTENEIDNAIGEKK